jgi:hypothetical protein
MEAFIEFLDHWEQIFWTAHIFGLVLGLGGATMTDVMFFTFLKNYRISEGQAGVMHTMSTVVWVGLGLLLLSGLALYLPGMAEYNASDRFLTKMTAVGVVFVNGIFLNLWIEPKMVRISFVEQRDHGYFTRAKGIRRLAFALGAVSFVSWYVSFLLASLEMIDFAYVYMVLAYLVLVLLAVAGSQIAELYLEQKAEEEHID